MKTLFLIRISLVMTLLTAAGQLAAQQVCSTTIERTRTDSRYEAVAGATPAGSEVKDKVTGLIWKRCLEGTTWDGATCTGNAGRLSWTRALDSARTATVTTASPVTVWRLPNRNELLSLAETACIRPAINVTWFPKGSNLDDIVWSSSSLSNFPDSAWNVVFTTGSDSMNPKDFGSNVRLVRSGQ